VEMAGNWGEAGRMSGAPGVSVAQVFYFYFLLISVSNFSVINHFSFS